MSRLRSLLWFIIHSFAIPLADDDGDGDDDNDSDDSDECGSQPVQHLVITSTLAVHVPDGPSAAILAPYQRPPTPYPSPSQHLHATVPAPHRSQATTIFGTMVGIVVALVALCFTARYVVRRRRIAADPFKDPPKSIFAAFRLRTSIASKKRLSDESWVSPVLPPPGSPGSPFSHDLELSRYVCPQRKLVPVTTPVCTPTDTEFGSRLEYASGDPIHVPLVRVPSPVYISPFSPSPSLSSSASSLSPTPSTEPLTSPSPVRFSRLLSSTFRDTRDSTSPARPTTAYVIQTTRSFPHDYRPSSATTSLYSPYLSSVRSSGTRSRTSFYPGPTDDPRPPWGGVRDTFSTMTTSDTDTVCTVPHLLRAVAEIQPSISPFADPDPHPGNELSTTENTDGRTGSNTPVGTTFGLKLRLSDASEHARYRLRERERERQRQREREHVAEQFSADTQMSEVEQARKEFKLRDSESVLREIGW